MSSSLTAMAIMKICRFHKIVVLILMRVIFTKIMCFCVKSKWADML